MQHAQSIHALRSSTDLPSLQLIIVVSLYSQAHLAVFFDACLCCLFLQIVMFSILGFGALTKPLLAAMLGGDTTLMEHIRTIPLLRCVPNLMSGTCW